MAKELLQPTVGKGVAELPKKLVVPNIINKKFIVLELDYAIDPDLRVAFGVYIIKELFDQLNPRFELDPNYVLLLMNVSPTSYRIMQIMQIMQWKVVIGFFLPRVFDRVGGTTYCWKFLPHLNIHTLKSALMSQQLQLHAQSFLRTFNPQGQGILKLRGISIGIRGLLEGRM